MELALLRRAAQTGNLWKQDENVHSRRSEGDSKQDRWTFFFPPHIPHKYETVPSVNNAASALITAPESIGELWHVMNLLWILNRNGGSLQGAAKTKDMRSNAIMQQSSFLLKAPNWLVDYAFSAPPSRWVFFNSSIMTLLYWTAKSQPIRIVIGSN